MKGPNSGLRFKRAIKFNSNEWKRNRFLNGTGTVMLTIGETRSLTIFYGDDPRGKQNVGTHGKI
jgi:hypothetical protein